MYRVFSITYRGGKDLQNIFKLWNKDILSIDIGSHSIKLLVGKNDKGNISISKAVTIETPTDSYYDGEIINMLSIKEVIKEALHNNKIRAAKTVCTLESSSVIAREIDMPSVKPEQMKSMLEFEIEQYLPIEIDEYIIQYKMLEEFKFEGIDKTRVLVTALPKKIAGDYYSLVESLGLSPVSLDLHSNVVDKVFGENLNVNNLADFSNKTIAVIDLGHSQINIIMIEKGIFKFNRLLKMGGRDIDTNICNFLDFNLEEAGLKKKSVKDISAGMQHLTAASAEDTVAETSSTYLEKEFEDFSFDSRLINIIKTSIDKWVTEIEKVFKYYTTRNTGNVVDEIYIYGGNCELGGIEQYLESALNIPTYKINTMGSLTREKEGTNINIACYVNNIGALIRR